MQVKKMMMFRDTKAEKNEKPFIVNSLGEAERVLHQAANAKESAIAQFPEDYVLFHVADWDEFTGEVKPIEGIRSIGCAINYVKKEDPTTTDNVTQLKNG